jgi:hypothetical protein
MKLDFVRGHMGGNLIILLRGDQLPAGRELEIAVKLMGPNYLHAHEAGILYRTGTPGQIEVKIVEPTLPCFISACGGFTQVLGAALIETELGELFGVEQGASHAEALLLTGCGPTKLNIETLNHKAVRIMTDMECFVDECYERGVGPLHFHGVDVMQAGKFLVVDAEKFSEACPEADFTCWNDPARDLMHRIQHDFMKETGEAEPNVVLYDWSPLNGGDLRAVFPHYVQDDFFEPSCGTGSVALGIALMASGELSRLQPGSTGRLTLNIESGGGIELGGPEITLLEMNFDAGRVSSAVFSHSLVEVTAVGEARV